MFSSKNRQIRKLESRHARLTAHELRLRKAMEKFADVESSGVYKSLEAKHAKVHREALECLQEISALRKSS